jgi:hypothetical protein
VTAQDSVVGGKLKSLSVTTKGSPQKLDPHIGNGRGLGDYVWRDTLIGVFAKVAHVIGCADARAMDSSMVAPTVGNGRGDALERSGEGRRRSVIIQCALHGGAERG